MEDFSNTIAMILPPSLSDKAEATLKELQVHIPVHRASLNDAVTISRDLESRGLMVLIVRGGTEFLLDDTNLAVSIVSIPVTALDVSRAVAAARRLGEKVGLIAFPNMVSAIRAFEEISGTRQTIRVINQQTEVADAMRDMSRQGIEVIVGGGIINQYAAEYSLQTVVIDSDKEAILSAVNEAKRILRSVTNEKEQAQRFKTIIENIDSGLISVDQDERVQIVNPSAERLLRYSQDDLLGRKLGSVFPWLQLTDVIYSRQAELDHIHAHKGRSVIFSKIPILVSGSSRGAIAVLEDVETIRRMEEKNRLEYQKKGHFAKHTFSDMITCSDRTIATIAIAKQFARSESTIYIEGETGTGKEIFAQSIHNHSIRAAGPFVAVNCAALPESLLDSELFGYVSGAFTGADRKGKEGLFEMAHTGTIFLDEISEMDLSVQGRLLRVLQEKSIMRIGDNKLLPIDVRVIAASNRDIRQQVQAGNFREDLFYRLNVLNLHLEPIRRRQKDIPLLIEHFIQEIAPNFFDRFAKFSPDEMALLLQHPWHGNVREIKNFAERYVLFRQLSLQPEISLSHLLEGSWNSRDTSGGDVVIAGNDKQQIIRALEQTGGNLTRAAELLAISRTTLWRRMKQYDIQVG